MRRLTGCAEADAPCGPASRTASPETGRSCQTPQCLAAKQSVSNELRLFREARRAYHQPVRRCRLLGDAPAGQRLEVERLGGVQRDCAAGGEAPAAGPGQRRSTAGAAAAEAGASSAAAAEAQGGGGGPAAARSRGGAAKHAYRAVRSRKPNASSCKRSRYNTSHEHRSTGQVRSPTRLLVANGATPTRQPNCRAAVPCLPLRARAPLCPAAAALGAPPAGAAEAPPPLMPSSLEPPEVSVTRDVAAGLLAGGANVLASQCVLAARRPRAPPLPLPPAPGGSVPPPLPSTRAHSPPTARSTR